MSPTKDAPPAGAMTSRPPSPIRPARLFSLVGALLVAGAVGSGGCSTEGSSSAGSGGTNGNGSGGGSGMGTGSGNATGASGGVSGTGGAASGAGSGGSGTGSGGTSASGGALGSGGRPSGSGGLTGTGSGGVSGTGSGGINATGGRSGTGGLAAGGSSAASGGASGAGGASASGGAGTGGAASSGGTSGTAGATGAGGSTPANPMMNFFVSSDTSTTANLGGLTGADARCQRLAAVVGAGNKSWRAYLSAATPLTNAIDRIGAGPYYNAQGTLVAADKAALHARAGDAALFLTERGMRVNGQWTNSPMPLEHDILTGTLRDGTIATGNTCGDWTATSGNSQVGHSDGLGPSQSTTGMYSYWNSAHTGQCGNTAPGGGAGRIYCFVGP